MKNLSKVVIVCLINLMILSSCSKEENMFTLDPNVTPVSTGDLSNDFILEEPHLMSSKTHLESYEYVGQVINMKSKMPVSLAVVELYSIDKNGNGRITKTDESGIFKLKLNTEIQKVNIRVTRTGYETQIINLSDLFENTVVLEPKRKPISVVKYTTPIGNALD